MFLNKSIQVAGILSSFDIVVSLTCTIFFLFGFLAPDRVKQLAKSDAELSNGSAIKTIMTQYKRCNSDNTGKPKNRCQLVTRSSASILSQALPLLEKEYYFQDGCVGAGHLPMLVIYDTIN